MEITNQHAFCNVLSQFYESLRSMGREAIVVALPIRQYNRLLIIFRLMEFIVAIHGLHYSQQICKQFFCVEM